MSKSCASCGISDKLKKQTVTYLYQECGLENIYLENVARYECPRCQENFINLGNIEKLHELLGTILLTKSGVLSGKEVRFLRRRLGYSGAKFAQLIGYTNETLSRIENGTTAVTESFDRLVRFAYAHKLEKCPYDLHELLLENLGQDLSQIHLRSSKNGRWIHLPLAHPTSLQG